MNEIRKLQAIDSLLSAARELIDSAETRDDAQTAEFLARQARYVVTVDAASPIAPHVRVDLVIGCGDAEKALTVFQFSTAPGFFDLGDAA